MAYNYLTTTGVIVPDESAVLSDVQQEYRDVFGANLDVSETSPQGKLIAAEVKSRIGAAQNNAAVANQINPNVSEGTFFDALWALLGGARNPETKSTFTAPPTLTGAAGTLIPAGALAETPAGDRFVSLSAVTLDSSGSGTVGFQSVAGGPIPAAVGQLSNIVTSVIGWETITNTVAATPGQLREGGALARKRRRDTVGANAATGPAAIIAELRGVPGVNSVSFRQNVFDTTQIIDTITLVPNSIWTCVDGGTDDAVGLALLRKHGGANFNGAVSVSVTEPASQQTYPVKFDRGTNNDILIRVTANVPTSVTDPTGTIRQLVLDYAAGTIGDGGGFILDADVAPFEIGAAINQQNPLIFIRNIEIALKEATPTYSAAVYPIAINQKAAILETDITVTII